MRDFGSPVAAMARATVSRLWPDPSAPKASAKKAKQVSRPVIREAIRAAA